MRVLVIPDCHLKPWMFEKAAAIMSGERTVDFSHDFNRGRSQKDRPGKPTVLTVG